MLGFKFAKSCGWIARYWRSQTTGSATGTCNPTVDSVNGNAKIFRRYADRQTLGQHHTDGRLSKLTGINSHRGHETRSFWRDQTRQFLVSTKSGEVHPAETRPGYEEQPWFQDPVQRGRVEELLLPSDIAPYYLRPPEIQPVNP